MKLKKLMKLNKKQMRKIKLIVLIVVLLFGIGFLSYTHSVQAKKIYYKKLRQYNFNPKTVKGKYIEVNLTQQKMYLWNNQIIEKDYLISSGIGKRFTPDGKYKIEWKRVKNYGYNGWMIPYSMKIADQILIHQVPIKKNGMIVDQDKLGKPASDGCVRVGVGSAKEVYNWTPVGTPVYIHY